MVLEHGAPQRRHDVRSRSLLDDGRSPTTIGSGDARNRSDLDGARRRGPDRSEDGVTCGPRQVPRARLDVEHPEAATGIAGGPGPPRLGHERLHALQRVRCARQPPPQVLVSAGEVLASMVGLQHPQAHDTVRGRGTQLRATIHVRHHRTETSRRQVDAR